jgi:hypothetical protein
MDEKSMAKRGVFGYEPRAVRASEFFPDYLFLECKRRILIFELTPSDYV